MTKTQTIAKLNEKIDELIMTGLETEKQRARFKKLARLHKTLIIEHLNKCLT